MAGLCIRLEGDEVPLGRYSLCSMHQLDLPKQVTCGSRPNRLVYQLSRIVLPYLRFPPPPSLDQVRFHNDITAKLSELAQN